MFKFEGSLLLPDATFEFAERSQIKFEGDGGGEFDSKKGAHSIKGSSQFKGGSTFEGSSAPEGSSVVAEDVTDAGFASVGVRELVDVRERCHRSRSC